MWVLFLSPFGDEEPEVQKGEATGPVIPLVSGGPGIGTQTI